jgi:hypothetical protein
MTQVSQKTRGIAGFRADVNGQILRPARADNIVSAGKFGGRLMQFTRILAAVVIAVSLGSAASAQQGGTPKAPPPTTHHSHVGRDICTTHPNLPQCS